MPRNLEPSSGVGGADAVQDLVNRLVSLDSSSDLEQRGLGYLRTGYPLHLRGPAGSGKTTLALRIASQLNRPVILLVGDTNFDTSRLVGHEEVTRTSRVVDCHTSNVIKVEAQNNTIWFDRGLSVACTEGCTLIYDEFNRSPAAANNALLSVLEERLLVTPKSSRGESYVAVHPDFRAIFTSNPLDPAGTHPVQEGLLDRMITLDLDAFDRDTEISIVAGHSGLKLRDAARIVDIVRDFRASRAYAQRPTLRASIMIANIAVAEALRVATDEPRFVQVCLDVLGSKLQPDSEGLPDPRQHQLLTQLIDHFCAVKGRMPERGIAT